MTPLTPTMDDLVDEVRERLTPRDEGALMLLILDREGEIALAVPISDAAGMSDKLFCGNLAHIIEETCEHGVIIAIVRAAAEASAGDLAQWEEIARRTDKVRHVIVLGRRSWQTIWRAA